MSTLNSIDAPFQSLDLVYANTLQDKNDIYTLRFLSEKEAFPAIRSTQQVIDARDKHAHHLLLRSKTNHQAVATIRLFQHAIQPNKVPPIYEQDLLVFGEPLINFTADEFMEVDQLYTAPGSAGDELKQLMHLSALAFARLMFQKFFIMKMSCKAFKAQRAKGLLLEQTCYALLDDRKSAYFYCATDDGVARNSAAWGLYEHILGLLAHQVNQPLIEGHHSSEQKRLQR